MKRHPGMSHRRLSQRLSLLPGCAAFEKWVLTLQLTTGADAVSCRTCSTVAIPVDDDASPPQASRGCAEAGDSHRKCRRTGANGAASSIGRSELNAAPKSHQSGAGQVTPPLSPWDARNAATPAAPASSAASSNCAPCPRYMIRRKCPASTWQTSSPDASAAISSSLREWSRKPFENVSCLAPSARRRLAVAAIGIFEQLPG